MSCYVCVVCALVTVTSLPPVTLFPSATSLPPMTSLPPETSPEHLSSLIPETSLTPPTSPDPAISLTPETSSIPETSFIPVTSLSLVKSQYPVTSLAVPTINSELTLQTAAPPGPGVSEISRLEEEIKHSLRKDNDDYLLQPHPGAAPPHAYLLARRFNQPLTPINSYTAALLLPPQPPGAQRNDARKLAQRYRSKHVSHKPRDRSPTTHREGHANKIKSLDKRQRLFMYTSSTKISPSSAPLILRSYSPPKTRRAPTTKPTTGHTKPIARIEFLPHKPWGTHAPEDRRPPNADQLDMAPARGAYIHDLRLKGRFCHRHVLWPEGPKYDSKGNVIMPAFNAEKYNKGRDFAQTTKAMFLLPRCCNCCKKSVLGCQ